MLMVITACAHTYYLVNSTRSLLKSDLRSRLSPHAGVEAANFSLKQVECARRSQIHHFSHWFTRNRLKNLFGGAHAYAAEMRVRTG